MIHYEVAIIGDNGIAYFASRGTAGSVDEGIENYVDSCVKNWPRTFRKIAWNKMHNDKTGETIRVIGHEYDPDPEFVLTTPHD